MIMADQTRAPGKHKFIFSNEAGRAWEARQNAEETRALLRRLVPDASSEPPSAADPALSGASGSAFRRVMAILQKNRGGK